VEEPKPKVPKLLTSSANRLKEQLQLSTRHARGPETGQTQPAGPKRRLKK
jgi:hypothetical protein